MDTVENVETAKKIIEVTVRDRVATHIGDDFYVCGNTEYEIHFDFDEEWDALDIKTARFIADGNVLYPDRIFSGNVCSFPDNPPISNTTSVRVGVFAGNLHTTTPARIPAVKSILCGTSTPAAPDEDAYHEAMEEMAKVATEARTQAEASAQSAEASAQSAGKSAQIAAASAQSAEASAQSAVEAGASAKAAATSATNAAASEAEAVKARDKAITQADDAEESAKDAAASATAAATSAANAANSATESYQSFRSASSAATTAKQNATAAEASATEAKTAQADAKTSVDAAAKSATSAATSAANAAASEKNAATSAQAASESANAAAKSQVSAGGYAAAAGNKAQDAANSAATAATSAEEAKAAAAALPGTSAPLRQLVTDPDGAVKWEERLAYKINRAETVTNLAPQTLAWGEDGVFGLLNPWLVEIESGKTYRVTYNGSVYLLEALPAFDGCVVLGDAKFADESYPAGNPDAPFALLCYTNEHGADNADTYAELYTKDAPDTATLEITHEQERTYKKTIDPELLPKGSGGAGLPETADPLKQLVTDADGNVAWEDRLAYKQTVQVVNLAATALTFISDDDGYALTTPWAADVVAGAVCTVNYNGADYECKAIDLRVLQPDFPFDCCALGNFDAMGMTGIDGSNTDAPFVLLAVPNAIAVEVGAYANLFPMDGATTVTLSVSSADTAYKTIDPKYLPKQKQEALTFTGRTDATYDGSMPMSIEIPTALPNPKALTFTGATSATYNGNSALTVDIPKVPKPTTSDAGKFLRVNTSGAYALEAIANAEEASF